MSRRTRVALGPLQACARARSCCTLSRPGDGASTAPGASDMKKILIIDDDPAMQSLAAKLLQARGFQTLSAGDGREGIEVARRYGPDLIICDVQMPNLDGYQTLAALQQDPLTSTIPFVFLTGVTGPENLRYAMGLGADDYLTKPYTVKELMAAVNTRLAKRAAQLRVSEKKLEELRSNIGTALPHELLTPLNGVLGLAGILADEGTVLEPPEVREFARGIQQSGMRLHRLIENFIVYSGLELLGSDPKQIAELRQQPAVRVRELIEQVAREQAEAAAREADLRLDLEDVAVVITPDRMRKAAEELLQNAFKFSNGGRPVRVTAQVTGRQYVLAVADEGRGMTAEQIASIGAHMQFERRFYEQQGAGLGLIITRRIAQLYGGDLVIESVHGQQTVAQFLLPVPRTGGSANP
jgi:two-component system, sensor histidine kinase and response regulator